MVVTDAPPALWAFSETVYQPLWQVQGRAGKQRACGGGAAVGSVPPAPSALVPGEAVRAPALITLGVGWGEQATPCSASPSAYSGVSGGKFCANKGLGSPAPLLGSRYPFASSLSAFSVFEDTFCPGRDSRFPVAVEMPWALASASSCRHEAQLSEHEGWTPSMSPSLPGPPYASGAP